MSLRLILIVSLWSCTALGIYFAFNSGFISRDVLFWTGIDPVTGEKTGGELEDGWVISGNHLSDQFLYGMLAVVVLLLTVLTVAIATIGYGASNGSEKPS